MVAPKSVYLHSIVEELKKHWPNNRTVNIVCHGHSVPAGYFATPFVDSFNAYPYLLHKGLKERFPFAVINIIVTAIGGENAITGANRFPDDVLIHRPDVVLIDYALNDRNIGLTESEKAWRSMIERALESSCKVILLTPTWDNSNCANAEKVEWLQLIDHADQVRRLANEFEIGLCDSFTIFDDYVKHGGEPTDLLSWSNHPNRRGHLLVASHILQWFGNY